MTDPQRQPPQDDANNSNSRQATVTSTHRMVLVLAILLLTGMYRNTLNSQSINIINIYVDSHHQAPSASNTNLSPERHLQVSRQASPQRVLMSTFLFGKSKRRFRMFVESARHAGDAFDFVVLGDAKLDYELPPNVKHYNISWVELADRVIDKVFQGEGVDPKRLKKLRNTKDLYKVCEYKALFAYLFPEVVEGYQWWGHIDNDLIVGNLTKMFPQETLHHYDALAGDANKPQHWSWGPFMLYRNTPVVNELFLKSPNLEIFHDTRYYYFDEWGGHSKGTQKGSMTHLLKEYHEELGIVRGVTTHPMMLDQAECGKHHKDKLASARIPSNCAECVFNSNPSTNQGRLLTQTSKNQQEVFLCHYQWSKKLNLDASLNDTAKFEEMIQSGHYRVDYRRGFHPIRKPAAVTRGNSSTTSA